MFICRGIERFGERNQLPARIVGADSIRPKVAGASCSVNGTMLDVVPFDRVLSNIRGFGRMLSAPTAAAAKPPTGRLIVDPYSGRVRLSERSIFPPVSEQSRHRAGQGTNVLVQSP